MIQEYFKRFSRRLEQSSYDPRPGQVASLKNLVSRLGSSEMAQFLGFDRVLNGEAARRLPITNYETYKSEIQKVNCLGPGAASVLGRSKLIGMAQTSGTTSATPKVFPLNRAFLSSYHRFMRG